MEQAPHGTRKSYKAGCRCGVCVQAQQAYDRAYYAANKAKRLEQVAAWREANPEKMRSFSKAQYHRDPAKAYAATKASTAKKPDEARARGRKWSATPQGKATVALKNSRRRALVTDDFTADFIKVLLNDPCSYCGGPAGTIDHIVPVVAGGTSECVNLTAACLSCNASKRDQSLLGFLSRQS